VAGFEMRGPFGGMFIRHANYVPITDTSILSRASYLQKITFLISDTSPGTFDYGDNPGNGYSLPWVSKMFSNNYTEIADSVLGSSIGALTRTVFLNTGRFRRIKRVQVTHQIMIDLQPAVGFYTASKDPIDIFLTFHDKNPFATNPVPLAKGGLSVLHSDGFTYNDNLSSFLPFPQTFVRPDITLGFGASAVVDADYDVVAGFLNETWISTMSGPFNGASIDIPEGAEYICLNCVFSNMYRNIYGSSNLWPVGTVNGYKFGVPASYPPGPSLDWSRSYSGAHMTVF
jgi:hypothetical protein